MVYVMKAPIVSTPDTSVRSVYLGDNASASAIAATVNPAGHTWSGSHQAILDAIVSAIKLIERGH